MRPALATGRSHSAAVSLLARSSSRWRRALLSRCVDAGELLAGRRVLVLAPHPDDETLGCGATIARARAAGDPVTVVAASDGRHSSRSAVLSPAELARRRSAELRAACAALGVAGADVLELGFEDGTLGSATPALAELLAGLLAQHQPEVLLVPCAQDDHTDHRASHLALAQAVRRTPGDYLVLAYPIWAWRNGPWFPGVGVGRRLRLQAWSVRQATAGRWVRVPAGPHLAAKRVALAEHASQTTNLTGEPSWSYLHAEDCALFLQDSEIFLPLPELSTRDLRSRVGRQTG
jgi:LmbE family N-acetylglucosaminyl deacetylase